MAYANNVLDKLVPISQFNKGQAARIFDRLREEKEIIVLKNNRPSAVILALEEYSRLLEIEEKYLLFEANRRLEKSKGDVNQSLEMVMDEFGIKQEDIDNAEDDVFF